MRDNRDFVVLVNILTLFVRVPFSWAARHTTVCLLAGNDALALLGPVSVNRLWRFEMI